MSNEPPVLPPRPAAPQRAEPTLLDRFHHLRREPLVGVLVLVLIAIAAGALWFRTETSAAETPSPPDQPGAEPAGAEADAAVGPGVPGAGAPGAPTPSTLPPADVIVHVAGAVEDPGVVTLAVGSRVVDAVEAAGGAVKGADLDRLNLAAVLADGQRVLVARIGDPPTPSMPDGGTDDLGGEAPLDINTASEPQLESLPGIGPERAAAIVAERERRGGFTSVGQLSAVRGIGEKTIADLRDLVTV